MPQPAPPGPAWLVLPTYDEAANIEAFAEAVETTFRAIRRGFKGRRGPDRLP